MGDRIKDWLVHVGLSVATSPKYLAWPFIWACRKLFDNTPKG